MNMLEIESTVRWHKQIPNVLGVTQRRQTTVASTMTGKDFVIHRLVVHDDSRDASTFKHNVGFRRDRKRVGPEFCFPGTAW